MRKNVRMLGALALIGILVVGLCVVLTPGTALAKGKPQPPPCPCPETIQIGDMVCVLDACGFDCVYVCPLPF
ncbi:MAG: hypothetical protein JSU63_10340 [Phycisphaerales bacterium]|nr:MAG: hypothetical protein JSU63_10340 [Phycisphaerales bacterium]